MNMAVKETQLLLKAPLVIATLEGIKTMTRRLQGLELVNENPWVWVVEFKKVAA